MATRVRTYRKWSNRELGQMLLKSFTTSKRSFKLCSITESSPRTNLFPVILPANDAEIFSSVLLKNVITVLWIFSDLCKWETLAPLKDTSEPARKHNWCVSTNSRLWKKLGVFQNKQTRRRLTKNHKIWITIPNGIENDVANNGIFSPKLKPQEHTNSYHYWMSYEYHPY